MVITIHLTQSSHLLEISRNDNDGDVWKRLEIKFLNSACRVFCPNDVDSSGKKASKKIEYIEIISRVIPKWLVAKPSPTILTLRPTEFGLHPLYACDPQALLCGSGAGSDEGNSSSESS